MPKFFFIFTVPLKESFALWYISAPDSSVYLYPRCKYHQYLKFHNSILPLSISRQEISLLILNNFINFRDEFYFCGFYRCVNFSKLSSKAYFVDIIAYFRSRWKESSSEIPAHGIYRSVKLFLQPIKLLKIGVGIIHLYKVSD